jgi:acyl-coenzyme A thioesterase PaaI-like protein
MLMGLDGRQTRDGVVLQFDDGPWCRDARGEVALTAFGVLLDTALGAVTRLHAGDKRQHATVHIEAHFTGASTLGHLRAKSQFMGFSERTALPHGMSRATVTAGRTPIVHASGSFVILDLPEGAPQRPPAWMRDARPAAEPLDLDRLEDHERQVLDAFERAQNEATPEHAFVDCFWGGTPVRGEGGARLTVPVSAHLGNRVGNVHGGILFGLAARVANAAAPPSMRLSNLSAWFVSPGQGPALEVRSGVVHGGRNLAVVRTEILGATGKRVLEVTSQHVAQPPRLEQGEA